MSRRLRVRIEFTPADLWPVERRFKEPDLEVTASPLLYGADARACLDAAVLKHCEDLYLQGGAQYA